MDIATFGGLISGAILVLFGALHTGLSILDVVNVPALFITLGGSIAATVISNPISSLYGILGYSRFALFAPKLDVVNLILTLVSFSESTRRKGLLSLEDHLVDLDEPFLRYGLQLVVDGADPELVRNILETNLNNIQQRHAEGIRFWTSLGTFLPAFGMIGTLLGLIQMLKSLGSGDPTAIGAGMAAALITTLYGVLGANLIAIPIRNKLELRDQEETSIKSIMLEGILSIQSGDNPRIVKDRLFSYLAPADRGSLNEASSQVFQQGNE